MAEKKKDVKKINSFFPMLAKYDMSSVKIEDKGLERYINLNIENIIDHISSSGNKHICKIR